MAYTKHTWTTGEVITAGRLNNMENGIADAGNGGTLVIGGFIYDSTADLFSGTSDKTWQEIDDALAAGVRCVIVTAEMAGGHSQTVVSAATSTEGEYGIVTNQFTATTTSVDGYPFIDDSGDTG